MEVNVYEITKTVSMWSVKETLAIAIIIWMMKALQNNFEILSPLSLCFTFLAFNHHSKSL